MLKMQTGEGGEGARAEKGRGGGKEGGGKEEEEEERVSGVREPWTDHNTHQEACSCELSLAL